MQQRYEYTFVRLKIGIFSNRAEHEYQETIHRHARAGWRLVQVFSPGIGLYGSATFYELMFERPVS